jgi:MFS family permease|tara:strand:+ start:1819 stop:3048 length:1230 start_codon:yes stop_codon:yes gene_type:complete
MDMLKEFKLGYKALLGAMIGAGCGLASISFYTHSVFVTAISQDTDWSRGQIQMGVSIMILMAIVTAPIVGSLVDRFGARIIALFSIPLYGLSMSSFVLIGDDINHYYFVWTVMSIIAAGTLPVTWTRVVNQWFDNSRGIALGLTLAGTGIAATFGPTYVTSLIQDFGWRKAYLFLALTVSFFSMPAVFFLFKEPIVKNTSNETKTDKVLLGVAFRDALQGHQFWYMGIALIFAAGGISGLITNSVPMLIDKGFTLAEAASYAGLIGLSVILGRLVVGFLLDYFWAPMIAAIFLSSPLIAAIILVGNLDSSLIISLSMIIIGLAAGAELDLLAFLASRYFGLKEYGKLYGSLYVFFSIGAGLAPAAFGRYFDANGDYELLLYIVIITSLISGLLMLKLGPYPSSKKLQYK